MHTQGTRCKRIRATAVLVLAAMLLGGTLLPLGVGDVRTAQAAAHPSQPMPPLQAVGQLAQQAQLVFPGDPRFEELHARWREQMPAVPQALQAQPRGHPISLGRGITFFPFRSVESLDLRQIASGQIPAALLGVLQLPPGTKLGGHPLPPSVGVGAMHGSLVLVLFDLTTGTVIAFVLLPSSLILVFTFFPVLVVIQVLVHLIFVVPVGFPIFPFLPVAFVCPALPNVLPVSVPVGSGVPLLSLPGAFEIREGSPSPPPPTGLPALQIRSLGPAVQFSLLSAGGLQLGFLGGGATGTVRLPLGTPFRLLVQGGGKTACLQAVVLAFGFALQILGTIAHN